MFNAVSKRCLFLPLASGLQGFGALAGGGSRGVAGPAVGLTAAEVCVCTQ